MAMLLMVVLVGLMLGALLVPMLITQARTTRSDATRVQALNAAQAGIDVTLGLIRAGVTSVWGDSSKLPCGPLSGTMVNSVAAYSVTIEYFIADPDNVSTAAAMKCAAGYGTFDPATSATTPGFARFTSTGTVGQATNGSTAGRTLVSTYVFRTSNQNILGGLVQSAPAGSTALCMDVGPSSAGTAVLLQPCGESTPKAAQQVFGYRTDLTLQLISSITAANPRGLCLDSAHTPAVSGDAVQLDQCGLLGSPAAFTQQWSYNDFGQYQAATANSVTTGTLAPLCMNVATQAANQVVTLGACNSKWIPSPSVGPGAAALPQWANFGEFGRCIDVTATNPNSSFLINYPCKQNPFAGAKTWNQLFQAPAIPNGQSSVTGQISTCNSTPATTSASVCNAQKYCLTSPATMGDYVTVATCVTGNTRQTWTIYDGDNSLNYSTKYTVVSNSLCLGLGGKGPIPAEANWSTIDVETCSGTTDQKWNAQPSLLILTGRNTYEK